MQQRNFFILVGVLLMVLVTVVAMAMGPRDSTPQKTATPSTPHTAGLAGLGGAWQLTDHNGKAVSDRDYSGSLRLMFFGFTYCPDVCPTELKRLTMVLEALGEDAARVTPLFVTIDPERDSPAVLKEYLARFDQRFIGLTGSVKQIEHMENIYKVYAAKTDDPALSDYSMNHSALVYLIGPDDKVLQLFHSQDTPDSMVAAVRAALSSAPPASIR